jgi:hypothetical protein
MAIPTQSTASVYNFDLFINLDGSPFHTADVAPGWGLSVVLVHSVQFGVPPRVVCSFHCKDWVPPAESYVTASTLKLPFSETPQSPSAAHLRLPGSGHANVKLFEWPTVSRPQGSSIQWSITVTLHIPGVSPASTSIPSTGLSRVVGRLIDQGHAFDTKITVFARHRRGGGACSPASVFGIRDHMLGVSEAFDDCESLILIGVLPPTGGSQR